jgi:hypothetical protein
MYRIEVASGEETVFRSIEELAVGIRNGVVTPRSRVYHNASQKWLPIVLHPHYKKAMELPAARDAHTPRSAPVPPTPRSKPRVESHAVEPHAVVHEPERKPAPARNVPAPVTSPVVAMQQEVLRDLPVVAIPEPLPWSRPPAPATPAAQAVAQAVQSQPTATVTYTPRVEPEPAAPPLQFEPVEATPARPTARRSHRAGGRPLLLVGVAAALVLAAHFALTATRSASADASDTAEPEDAASRPAESAASAAEPVARVTPRPSAAPAARAPARITSAPARVRMTPGPAFAGSVPTPPGADTSAGRPKAAVAAAAAAAAAPADSAIAAPSIAPRPVDVELALPDLPKGSIAPTRTGDTLAMKKILRALNGSKP